MYGVKRMIVYIAVFLVFTLVFFLSVWMDIGASQIDEWEAYIEEVCEERNICPELVQAVIEKESSWNPEARNGNCIGLMQINPEYQQERMEKYGVTAADLTDPYDNILIGVDYLRELFEKYEDVYAVLMFYNAGYSDKHGLGAWEDGRYSDYAVEVSERSAELERNHGK